MNNFLQASAASEVLVSTLSDSDLCDYLWSEKRSFPGNSGLIFCRGQKMRTLSGLFNEFSAAFQFPYYFGENWAALEDCLNDLSWFFADRYLLCITSAQELLTDEGAEAFSNLFQILVRTAREWSGENPNLSVMGRLPTIFRTIVQVPFCQEAAIRERLSGIGISATIFS